MFQDKKSSANVFQAPRPPPQPSRRRGKKSDDIDRNHHVNHQHLSDEELEEIIFQDTSQTPDSSNTPDSLQIQAAETKNTKFRPDSALLVTEVHRVQGENNSTIKHHEKCYIQYCTRLLGKFKNCIIRILECRDIL